MLEGYRIIDLTEGGAQLAGKLLADLGAEVIVAEPPGGSSTRVTGPFIADKPESTKSIHWNYLNLGKKSISVNLCTQDGQYLLHQLAHHADALIESHEPGFLAALGLGYEDLRRDRPDLIMASITPFGQTGPWRDYRACDLILQSLSGFQFLCGESGGPPLRVGFPQVPLLAAVEAAFFVVASLFHRGMTGRGQYIDLAMQGVAVGQGVATAATAYPALQGEMLERHGQIHIAGAWITRFIWECADGYVCFQIAPGAVGAHSQTELFKWILEQQPALVPDWIRTFDWATGYTMQTLLDDPRLNDRIAEAAAAVAAFFKTKTKKALFQAARERKLLLMPCNTAKDLEEHEQLIARDFFVSIRHEDLDREIRYPGQIARVDHVRVGSRQRAPRVGEHNDEIFGDLLGVPAEERVALHELGVI